MTLGQIFESVVKTLASQLSVKADTITAETDIIKDLKADSLDVVEMLMNLEEQFGISIPEDKAAALRTVGDIVAFIEKRKK